MSTALEYPERFAGLHFFNPVNRMPLVEIVTHSNVAPETIEALYSWCLKANKNSCDSWRWSRFFSKQNTYALF